MKTIHDPHPCLLSRTPARLRPTTPRQGFTLIELLVVISIIALLIAILLPALTNARAAGQRAVCLAQQKQLHVAASTFAVDQKNWLPYARSVDEHAGGGWWWGHNERHWKGDWDTVTGEWNPDTRAPMGSTLVKYLQVKTDNPTRSVAGMDITGNIDPGLGAFPVTMPKVVMTCPSVRGKDRDYWPSYGLNHLIAGNGGWPFPDAAIANATGWANGFYRQRFDDIRRPALTYMFGDRYTGADEAIWSWWPWSATFFPFTAGKMFGGAYWPDGRGRHNQTLNIIHVDGHGVTLKHMVDWDDVNLAPQGVAGPPWYD